jgi:hypothetical protein
MIGMIIGNQVMRGGYLTHNASLSGGTPSAGLVVLLFSQQCAK